MTARPTGASDPAVAIDVVDAAEDAARAVATELADVIVAAEAAGRGAVLGCPAGRTPRATFLALGALAAARDLDVSNVRIVMMDEYVVDGPDGFRLCADDAHYSCRHAAELDLRGAINDCVPDAHRIPVGAVHVPDPADPGAYDRWIAEMGGVDLFLVASGASDGHVAFNPPGTTIDADTRIVRLADSTRHDNLSTFPDFSTIDEVPQHGVTVGLGTIVRSSRRVVLLLVGEDKHESFRRVARTSAFDPTWPATLVHRCRDARVVADRAAAEGTSH